MARERRRSSLHLRIAGWMVSCSLATVAVFCAFLYLALQQEDASEPERGQEPLTREAGEQMLLATLLAGPIALVTAAGAAYLLSRRALAPLEELIQGARRITASSLAQRLPLPAQQDELYELTLELNLLLARLDVGFAALARHAAEASHELRTPLAIVIAQLEVASRQPEWQAVVSTSLAELVRLSRLVDALLALARADGPLEQETVFDARERLDWILASLAEQAQHRHIELSRAAEGEPACVHVVGDPDALRLALQNLLDNALRFTPDGGRVRASLVQEGRELSFRIDDSGPGVELDERLSIFTPLRRGRASPAAGDRGHGLGLAIVERVARRHQGSVQVTSSPEGGARFELRLPAAHDSSSGCRVQGDTAP